MPLLSRALAAAKAPPTLLDALARAPAAAALVVAALDQLEDRRALRLAHSQLRDAVGEATTKLVARSQVAAAARPPTARRWPRLEELTLERPDLAALEALGAETWGRLRSLRLGRSEPFQRFALDVPCARALAAALRRMPALRALELRHVVLSDADAEELFRASSAEGVPQLRAFTLTHAGLSPATACSLAATGWRLEELDLAYYPNLGAAGLAALLAAPTFALRRLNLANCGLDAAALLSLANSPWPLEELDLKGQRL